MKICIIGVGNMGGAIASGLVFQDKWKASDIILTAGHAESLDKYSLKGFKTTTDNVLAARESDVVMIAVKPSAVFEVIENITPVLSSEKTVVCIAAGINPDELIKRLESARGGCPDLVYVIPNTASEIGKGVSFITGIRNNHGSVEKVAGIFKALGSVKIVDLKGLGAGMVLSSCGIAYAMKYIQSCIEVGESLGLDHGQAREIVLDTVSGAAQLLKSRGTSTAEEIRRVATPGGHTEKGLNRMEADGFTRTIKSAMLESE